MASGNDFTIRCKTENGSFILKNVNGESTVQELKIHLSKETSLKTEYIKILHGYPPKELGDGIDSLKLKDVNIQSGEAIIIEKRTNIEGKPVDSSSEIKISDVKKHPETAANAFKPSSAARFDDLTGGIMMRHVVPANNSCLFASVSFVLSEGEPSTKKSMELRRIISDVVSSNPEKYNSAFLGKSNHDYCTWIQDADNWGGAIELSVLSEHFGIEIVALDAIYLQVLRFGENSNYTHRIFLIYDGIHYDPLVLELDRAPVQTVFSVSDDRPMEMAMEIAREANSSRQYTDIANFTLRCVVCGEKLRGDKEARAHALSTGHNQFGEITK